MGLIMRIFRYDSTPAPEQMEYAWDEMGGSIGRNVSNDWVLPDAQRFLSGRHAMIRCQDGDYYITDTSTMVC
ncbi:MAG: FHA domain-containing protein [Thiolinea sp.]